MSPCLVNGCYEEKEGYRSGNYCKDHTCKEGDCFDYAPSSSYCDEHGGEASDDSGSEACEDITCEDSDCDDDQMSDSDYCYTHTCHWGEVGSVTCREPALPDEEFCDKHADQLCEDCEEKPKQRRFSDWLGNYCHDCGGERVSQKEEHRLQRRIDRVRDGEESPDEEFWEDLKYAEGKLDIDHPWDLAEH